MKRRSDSGARRDDAQAAPHVARPSPAGGGSRASSVSRLPAIDLIGASELLSSWPSTRIRRCQAWRSSSRSARLTSVSTSSCVRQAALAEACVRRTSQRPAPPGNADVDDARRLARRGTARGRARRRSRPSSCSDGAAEQALAGAVHEPQRGARVEGEDGDVDLLHHRAQQRGRLERAEPLLAQRLGERVHLARAPAPSASSRRPARRADREVPLAQRGEQVRERLQRPRDRARARETAKASHETDHDECRASSACAAAGRSSRAASRRATSAGQRRRRAPAAGRAGRAAGVAAAADGSSRAPPR